MHEANALLLPEAATLHNWQAACKVMTLPPGRIAVEMDPERTKTRAGLLLPDTAAGRWRPDSGTVIAVGEGIDRLGLAPGDRVITRAYDGMIYEGFERGDYKAQNDVKFYKYSLWDVEEQKFVHQHIWDSIVAKVGPNGELLPIGGMVLVKRERVSHPLIPAEVAKPAHTGHVVRGGPLSGFASYEGARVAIVAHENDILRVQWGDEKDLVLVPFDVLQVVIDP